MVKITKYICDNKKRNYRATVALNTNLYRDSGVKVFSKIYKTLNDMNIKYHTVNFALDIEREKMVGDILYTVAFVFYCKKNLIAFKMLID